MIDAIYLALSGLRGYERGLRVIANNTANLNTPGFKGSSLQFADAYSQPGALAYASSEQIGLGLNTLGTMISFQQGQLQNTSNDLDLAVDGAGMFTVRDVEGNIRYTRDGRFKFDAEGVLVMANTDEQVMVLDENGALVELNIADLRAQDPHATERVTFGGTLSTDMDTVRVENATVIDRAGATHQLALVFTKTATDGVWGLQVLEGTTPLLTTQMTFENSRPNAASREITFTHTWPAQTEMTVTLDFSSNVLSYQMGSSSSLGMATQDGYAAGTLTATSFDANGVLVLTYSNGQTARNARLALGRFNSIDAVRQAGDNRFEIADERAWIRGVANDNGFGRIRSSTVETSNVDLSSEFSDLVIMQRGYQASSQVVSTANEMLADLLGLRGK